jgi:hypothetical protein
MYFSRLQWYKQFAFHKFLFHVFLSFQTGISVHSRKHSNHHHFLLANPLGHFCCVHFIIYIQLTRNHFRRSSTVAFCIRIPVFLGAVHTVTRRIPCKQNAAKYVPNPDGPISQVDFGSPRSSLKMAIANSAHHAKQQKRMRPDIVKHNTIRKCQQSTSTEGNFFPCDRGVFLTSHAFYRCKLECHHWLA